MQKTHRSPLYFLFLSVVLTLNACASQPVMGAVESTPSVEEDQTAAAQPTAEVELPTPIPTRTSLPAGLEMISAGNAASIGQLAVIQPDFPPYELISPDGRMGARANLEGIDVYEMAGGKLSMHIDVALPDCQFGWNRYFNFNQDGSFIAVVGLDAIQVWQVGGGLIYESAYNLQNSTDADTCGAEIPQLALSPDASLLAISGVAYSSSSADAYFRVISTLQNQVLYEWDGARDSLHGDLYTFRGLGFSSDGSVLQTFDASRYYAFSGEEYQAFRFWSTGDWQELPRNTKAVSTFQTTDQYYMLQGDTALQLKNRLDGKVQASLAGTSCTQAQPCDARLSPQADTVALLNTSMDTLAYHREVLATHLAVWDWASGTQIAQAQVLMRSLDGVLPAGDGSFLNTADLAQTNLETVNWWTSSFNFDGLYSGADGITFKPQELDITTEQDCYFCGTCSLDPANLQLSCQKSFQSQENNPWNVLTAAGQISLQSESGDTFVLELPDGSRPDWDVRLLGFSETYQTAFYCLDGQGRSQTCAIDMSGEKGKLTEVEDIYGLRFSADGSRAAYIDRREKALYLLNLETGKLTKMDAYQSRAWFVNPAFAIPEDEMSAELVYVVQNLKDAAILSLEWVDGTNAKVLRRSTLDTNTFGQPSALSLGEENGLVALGAQDGSITLLDSEKGKLVTSWQAGTSAIIGLAFTEEDSLLVSLDEQGNIRVWGVE
jgi:WD40 repeat protein